MRSAARWPPVKAILVGVRDLLEAVAPGLWDSNIQEYRKCKLYLVSTINIL